MPLHDLSYQHWQGAHLGLWRRRWVIAWNGISGSLQNRWMQYIVMLCWASGLAIAAMLFGIGQLLVPDSLILQWVGHLGPNLQGFARTIATWLEMHPEVSVQSTQNLLMYYFGSFLLWSSIFVLGMAIPRLITRDLSTRAIIIYSSKAVSRGDYLFGKFVSGVGLALLTWLGPMCLAWFMGNMLAPDWRFFWHARAVIFHIIVFGIISACLLSALALGVSAVSSKEKSTSALWFAWWVMGGVLVPIAVHTRPWLQHLSFDEDLQQIGLAVFRPGDDIARIRASVAAIGDIFHDVRPQTIAAISDPPILGAVTFLVIMLALAAVVVHKRVKPE